MTTSLKFINILLILFCVYMGLRQGWAMVSNKPEMAAMFAKWQMGKSAVTCLGALTIIGVLLMLFPRTFFWGNFITAVTILFLLALHLQESNIRGAFIELPFLLLSLLIIYLGHPIDS